MGSQPIGDLWWPWIRHGGPQNP